MVRSGCVLAGPNEVRMGSEHHSDGCRSVRGPYGVRTDQFCLLCIHHWRFCLRMASLIAGGSARYIALLMNLIAFNDKVIAQMVFIAEAPKGEEEDPTVTWDALKAASHAPLRDCTFADVRHLSLTLLHPTARRGSPI